MSLSARRAWIEIHNHLLRTIPRIVALRKESVDRNRDAGDCTATQTVALRKESVDRNRDAGDCTATQTVALRKESVDRNMTLRHCTTYLNCRSPQGERG